MSWKKALLIVGIIFVLLIAVYCIIFSTGSYNRGISQGITSYDLSGCHSISPIKYMVRSNSGFLGNSYSLKSQKKSCVEDVAHAFGLVDNEVALLVFLNAVKQNKPEICNGYDCLDKIKEKYKDPSVCAYYIQNDTPGNAKYSYVFGCQGYLIAFEKQNVSYCEQFDKDLKDYCYFSIASEYNQLRRMPSNPLVIHQTYEGVSYFRPKPNIPYICPEVNNSALKDSCEHIFTQFNSLETPTVNITYK